MLREYKLSDVRDLVRLVQCCISNIYHSERVLINICWMSVESTYFYEYVYRFHSVALEIYVGKGQNKYANFSKMF